jgi:hypothetical protein
MQFLFQQDENVTDYYFISFLSKEINVSEHDAGNRFSNFIQQLINKLQAGLALQLPGLGLLSKNDDSYNFIATDTLRQLYPGVSAERVIRQNAQHTVRVGKIIKLLQRCMKYYIKKQRTTGGGSLQLC